MTQDDQILRSLEEVRTELHELKSEVQQVRDCVIGRKYGEGPPSVLDLIKSHHRELYGEDNTRHAGMKEILLKLQARVETLEDERKKMYWASGGIASAASFLWWYFTGKP